MTVNLEIIGQTRSEYLHTIECAIARGLRDAVSTLKDPRITIPHEARRLVETIPEMLAGFTLGTLVRSLKAGMARWFGDALADELLRSIAGSCRMERFEANVMYLDDAKERPLVNAVATCLHLRYCAMSPALERILCELEAVVLRMAPNKQWVTNLMLGSLCNDADELARFLSQEIRFAWSMVSAVTSGKPVPSVSGRTVGSTTMWSQWLDHVPMACVVSQRSQTSESSPGSRDEVQVAGYILLVA